MWCLLCEININHANFIFVFCNIVEPTLLLNILVSRRTQSVASAPSRSTYPGKPKLPSLNSDQDTACSWIPTWQGSSRPSTPTTAPTAAKPATPPNISFNALETHRVGVTNPLGGSPSGRHLFNVIQNHSICHVTKHSMKNHISFNISLDIDISWWFSIPCTQGCRRISWLLSEILFCRHKMNK